MRTSSADKELCRTVANELGIDVGSVQNSVCSFFGSISRYARHLPFDNYRRIYTRDKFDSLAAIQNIPSIGRIGPTYSRYLKWRANEAVAIPQIIRKRKGKQLSEQDIETLADAILSGKPLPDIRKRKGTELFNRVWLVGIDGKKSARQVIPKENSNVQD